MWFVSPVSVQWVRTRACSCFFPQKIMKKNKQGQCPTRKRSVKVDQVAEDTNKNVEKVKPLDDEDQGFGGWLRSADGMDTMKLFVIANSIVMLTTIAFPHFQTILEIISEMMYGVIVWYSISVWNMISEYFNREFIRLMFNHSELVDDDEL